MNRKKADQNRTAGQKDGKSIGVFGLHPAAGVTHVTMLLASYCSSVLKQKTRVYAMDGDGAFQCMEYFLSGRNRGESFRTRRCVFCKGDNAVWTEADSGGDIRIYDFGSRESLLGRFLACDEKCIVGSAGIFHAGDWERFFARREVGELLRREGSGRWHFLQNHGETGRRTMLHIMEQEYGMAVTAYGLGTEENLLRLSAQAKQLFLEMGI